MQEQKDAIVSFAQKNELYVTKWFEEKETAAKSGRPVFNNMLRQLRKGAATGLIMHKIDRSARNLKDWSIVSELPDQGIDVYVATESLDFTTRGGRLTADMLAVIAADYIRNLREETRKGIRGRLKQGLYPFRAPLGYLDNGKGQAKTPCPTTAQLVRQAFELYATGQHSLRSLREEIHRQGFRNQNGRPLSMCGIETMLRNPFYTGVIFLRGCGETYQGIHEPIIPVSLFKRVQDIKAGKYGPKKTKHHHVFRGLFRCGLCKLPMTPELQKGHVYYRCHGRNCPTKTLREEVLDEHITSALRMYEFTKDACDQMESNWNAACIELEQKHQQHSLKLRIHAEEKRLERITDLLVDGTLDNQTYLTKKHETITTLTELKEQLHQLPNPNILSHHLKHFIELTKRLSLLYETLDPTEKRILIENTFSNRTVIGKTPYFKPHDWVCQAQKGGSVFSGLPNRVTNQTFEVPKPISCLFERYF